MRAWKVVLLLLLSIAGAVLAAPTTLSAQSGDAVARRLSRRLPELMDAAEIPGLSAALIRDGRVAWTGAFGVRNTETGAPVTDRTIFQAASLSKPVFAYVVMRLVERGVLDLDRPLTTYLANPRMAPDPRYASITARMVLSHSTGLPNWGGDTLDLAFDPGTAFRYSGEGYVYLQHVVESITGLGLEELARREVLEPLGMTRSSYVWLEAFEDDAAAGHDGAGHPGSLRRFDEPNAAYSLLTTAGDYARFVAAVMEGRGLEAATWRTMLAPVLPAVKPSVPDSLNAAIGWALGWGVESGVAPGSRGGTSYWHWGDNGTFKAFVTWDPAEKSGLVYFTNSTYGMAIAEDVVRAATGHRTRAPAWAGYVRWDDPERLARLDLENGRFEAALEAYRSLAAAAQDDTAADRLRDQAAWVEVRVRAARQPVEVPVERLRQLAGDYGPRHVVLEDGTLYYQRDDNPRYRLVPLGDGVFQPVGIETFRIRFDGGDGEQPEKIVGLYFDGERDETPRGASSS